MYKHIRPDINVNISRKYAIFNNLEVSIVAIGQVPLRECFEQTHAIGGRPAGAHFAALAAACGRDRHVAEDFAKGEAGTLFFLTSVSAKSVGAISRFPEEGEMLPRGCDQPPTKPDETL